MPESALKKNIERWRGGAREMDGDELVEIEMAT